MLPHHEELLPSNVFGANGLNMFFIHWSVSYKLKHQGASPSPPM